MTSHESYLYIGGEWREGCGDAFESIDPATGGVVWAGRAAGGPDVESACVAANAAADDWGAASLDERVAVLEAFCRAVEDSADELASAITSEIGKPLWEAKTEVSAVTAKLTPSVEAANERCREFRPRGSSGPVTRFRPLGVVAVIGPFNFPLHMPNVHVMPALLAGNAVVLKQTPLAPHCGELIMSCWDAAGGPPGVINLLQGGSDVGSELCSDPRVRGIFYTGSDHGGTAIAHASVGSGKLLALEMGGNTPMVVWDATDLDAAVYVAVQSCFVTSGQRCSSTRRLIVRQGAFGDAFLKRLAEVADGLTVGPPAGDAQPFMGPLVTAEAATSALEFQASLLADGAIPLLRATGSGRAYVTPGLLDITGLEHPSDREILGPIITVTRVDAFDEALRVANNTRFGLAACLISEDAALYERFRMEADVGVVSWNAATTGNNARAAFGGVKASGNYRPTGFYSCDYCSRAVGGVEAAVAALPESLPPGVSMS